MTTTETKTMTEAPTTLPPQETQRLHGEAAEFTEPMERVLGGVGVMAEVHLPINNGTGFADSESKFVLSSPVWSLEQAAAAFPNPVGNERVVSGVPTTYVVDKPTLEKFRAKTAKQERLSPEEMEGLRGTAKSLKPGESVTLGVGDINQPSEHPRLTSEEHVTITAPNDFRVEGVTIEDRSKNGTKVTSAVAPKDARR